MAELTTSMFKHREDRDAVDEALAAARIRAAKVVVKLQQTGTHWTLSAQLEKSQ